jgi:dolichol-phosphate mannosyltransferase
MDADLQDPPELLPDFVAKWREGYEVVYAIRQRRHEHIFKRFAYKAFYRLLKFTADIDIPLDAGDFCIMDRRVVELLVRMPERSRFIRGVRSWIGFNQVGIPVNRDERFSGNSKYGFFRLVHLAMDGLVSFSYMPLRFISLVGVFVSVLSIGLAIFYISKQLLIGLSPPGFATIVVMICFFAGVQLVTIGVIGEYVGRIFEEAKRRPLYIVKRKTGGD